MSIGFDSDCLQCHLRRNLELVRPLGSEEQAMAFAKDLLRMYLEAPQGVSSPWFAPQTAQLLHDHYGLPLDRFKREKEDSNRFTLERLELLRRKVETAADPVLTGLKLAIVGNYLDFSALQGKISFETFGKMLEDADKMELEEQVYSRFLGDLEQGKSLLYLTDNAGEIGFDRIFAETIAERYPNLTITFCVRGGPALNDATRADAKALGIPFPVIDNGNQIPGTQLDRLSREAREALERSDVIFAKGMANAETMLGCGYNVYYAFLIKCQRFVRRFKMPLMSPVLAAEREEKP